MKILSRYIIKEFFPSFLLGFSIFTFVLFVSNFFPLARIFFDERIGLETTLKLLSHIICLILPYSISTGVLLGSINCFGRLSQDSEITGLESCGIAPFSFISPIFVLCFFISLLCLYLFASVSPLANLGIKRIQEEFKTEDIVLAVEEKVLMDDFKDYKIYIDKIDGDKIKGVTIFKIKDEGTPSVITAKKGEIIISDDNQKTPTLKLLNGTIDEFDDEKPMDFTKAHFDTYYIELEPIRGKKEVNKKPWDMKLGELIINARYFQKQKIIPYHLLTEIHKRWSLSFSPLFFLMIGAVLGIKMKGKSKMKGFGLSMPVIIVYYIILLSAERISQKGVFYPFILMWSPNIFLAGFFIPYFLKKKI